ncbi:hypothetical protein [Rhodococcus sp. NPDC060176]|uniref:hypothetical protein n=1 Tax=Rhodococcus sp. NPDC060176 TaxID=3347062 RepID=UPI00364C2E39
MTEVVVDSGGLVVGREVEGDQAQFFRNSGSTLFPEELALLGEIDGSSILHLQCNSGQDSWSLAALGANVTGVVLSDSAIDFAGPCPRNPALLPSSSERKYLDGSAKLPPPGESSTESFLRTGL